MPDGVKVPRFSTLLVGLATLAYPLAVYLGFGRVQPVWLALLLGALMAFRAWAARDAIWLYAGAGSALLALAGAVGNSWLPLKLYPVLVSAVLLVVFLASLVHPPTIVERIARLREGALPPGVVRYTRKVTQVWCLFFLVNGLVSLATVLWGSTEAWALYNGLLAYVLMGILFAGEWLVRRRVRATSASGDAAGETHA